jgi:glucosamine 6-phosphate synthetase-like amidotransferase/phosphosugar isomerase protein
MCGLVGMAGALNQQHDGAFKNLLIVDSVRGPHSTGVLTVNTSRDVKIVKASGDPFELLGTKAYENVMRYANNVVMGHNRYATKGAINKTNAHPFDFEHVSGAHNGTLTTQGQLDDSKDFDVDSENL